MRLNGLCVDEGGRIARRLALVNSVVFRVMRHRSPHVLHPLATHFFYRSMFTISGYFRFVFYFWCFVCRQSPPGDPTPQPIASWPCRASERDFSARPKTLNGACLEEDFRHLSNPAAAGIGLTASSLQPKTVWLLFNSSDLNREMFLIAHVAIFFRATSPATQNRQKRIERSLQQSRRKASCITQLSYTCQKDQEMRKVILIRNTLWSKLTVWFERMARPSTTPSSLSCRDRWGIVATIEDLLPNYKLNNDK